MGKLIVSNTHSDIAVGGDVFVHAKCNTPSKLFELAQLFVNSLPAGSVKDFEDIYSFVYRNGRDLSGFIDGMVYIITIFFSSPEPKAHKVSL